MKITNINFNYNSIEQEGNKIKAYADVTFDDCFVIHSVKVVQGNQGLFVAMPSKRVKSGSFSDIAHPISKEFREYITEYILKAYEEQKVK